MTKLIHLLLLTALSGSCAAQFYQFNRWTTNSDPTAQLDKTNFNNGTGASSSTFLRGDGTWATVASSGSGSVSWNTNSAGTLATNTFTAGLVYFDVLGNLHMQDLSATSINLGSGSITANGSGLTSLNASQLTSGTVPDAAQGANVVRTNGGNTAIQVARIGVGIAPDANVGMMLVGGEKRTNTATGNWNDYTNGVSRWGPTNAAENVRIDGVSGGQTNSGTLKASAFVGDASKVTGLTASQISGVLPGNQVNFAPGANITFTTNGANVAIAGSAGGGGTQIYSNQTLTINGTANQITVSAGTQRLDTNVILTLSTPQNINSGASPTFDAANITSILPSTLTGSGTIPTGAYGVTVLQTPGNQTLSNLVISPTPFALGSSNRLEVHGTNLVVDALDVINTNASSVRIGGANIIEGFNQAGVSEFSLNRAGTVTIPGQVTCATVNSSGNITVNGNFLASGGLVWINTDGGLLDFGGNADLILGRDAAAILRLGAVASASPVNQTIKGQDGSGTDKPGGDVTVGAGKNTGTGTSGRLILATASPYASTGSTASNLVPRMTIDGNGIVGIANSFTVTNLTGYLTANVTSTSNTLANLVFNSTVTLQANHKYEGTMILFLSDSTAADGAQVDFGGGTATATSFRAHFTSFDSALNLSTQVTSLTSAAAMSTFTGSGMVEVHFGITVNAAGTFIPRVAQNTHSIGTLTTFSESHIWLRECP